MWELFNREISYLIPRVLPFMGEEYKNAVEVVDSCLDYTHPEYRYSDQEVCLRGVLLSGSKNLLDYFAEQVNIISLEPEKICVDIDSLDMLRHLVENHEVLITSKRYGKRTLLHTAIMNGDVNMSMYLKRFLNLSNEQEAFMESKNHIENKPELYDMFI